MEISTDFWRVCSTCKKKISYKAKYYECSVSTCTGKRTGYVFCSIDCWESHLPGARHRDAAAIEKISPSYEVWKSELSENAPSSNMSQTKPAEPQRRYIASAPGAISQTSSNQGNSLFSKSSMEHEVLVVVSKMKQYIKDKSDMNTSGDVSDVLSDIIRNACDSAMAEARAEGRKTVMARDFKK